MSARTLILVAASAVAMVALSIAARAQQESAPTADAAALYNRQCGICHEPGGFGTNVLAQRLGAEKSLIRRRADLRPAYVRHVVRNGVGDMPPLTRVELTDADLEAISQYLQRAGTTP